MAFRMVAMLAMPRLPAVSATVWPDLMAEDMPTRANSAWTVAGRSAMAGPSKRWRRRYILGYMGFSCVLPRSIPCAKHGGSGQRDASAGHLRGQDNGLHHVFGVGHTFPGDIVGCAVIDRGPNDGQPYGDVHPEFKFGHLERN